MGVSILALLCSWELRTPDSWGESGQRSQLKQTLESVSHLIGRVTLGKLPNLSAPSAAGLENTDSYTDLQGC